MTPECRQRVGNLLGRPLSEADGVEFDAAINRAFRVLSRTDRDFARLPNDKRMVRAADFAGAELRAEAEGALPHFQNEQAIRQAGREAYGERFDELVDTGRVRFVDKPSDISADLKARDDTSVAATMPDGTVALFRQNLDPEQVPGVLLHEVGVHAGMRGLIGDEAFDAVLKQVDDMLARGDEAAVAARQAVPTSTNAKHIREETLAYMMEFAPEGSFAKRIIGQIKAWLVKTFPRLASKITLDEEGLRQLALSALRSNKARPDRADIMFSAERSFDAHRERLMRENNLTAQEADAVEMVLNGFTRPEIADELTISPTHLAVLFTNARKKGVDVPSGKHSYNTGYRSRPTRDLVKSLKTKFPDMPTSVIAKRAGVQPAAVSIHITNLIKDGELPPRINPRLSDLRVDKTDDIKFSSGGGSGRRFVPPPDTDGNAPRTGARFLSAFGRLDPILNVLTSATERAKGLMEDIADINVPLRKNDAVEDVVTHADGTTENVLRWEPTKQSVETNVKRRTAEFQGRATKITDEIYVRYLYGTDQRPGQIFTAGVRAVTKTLPDGKLSRPEFKKEIIKAMRRGDAHPIAEIDQAAKRLRSEIWQPLEDELVEAGFFGFDMVEDAGGNMVAQPRRPSVEETAESYIPRLYDLNKIERQRGEFARLLRDHYVKKREKAAQDFAYEQSVEAQMRDNIKSLSSDIRAEVKARREMLAEGREGVRDAKDDVASAKSQTREAARGVSDATKRVDETALPDLAPEESAYLRALYRQVQKGVADDEPADLLTFIRQQGGVKGLGEAVDPNLATGLNLVNEKSGRHIDYVREAAAEAGYISADADLSEFGDIVSDAPTGRKIYSESDEAWSAQQEMIDQLRDRLGGADDFDQFVRLMKDGKAGDTKVLKGRAREAVLRHRQAMKRLVDGEDVLDDANLDLMVAKAYAQLMRETAPQLTKRIDDMVKQVRKMRRERQWKKQELRRTGIRKDLTDEEINADVERTIDRILGSPAGRLTGDRPGIGGTDRIGRRDDASLLSGRFKSRKLDMEDVALEPWLESDFDYITRSMSRSVIPDLEIVKRFGSMDMDLQLKGVAKSELESVNAAKSEGARATATKRRDQILTILKGQRDRLRGMYALPDNPNSWNMKLAQGATTLNTMRLMGGVTISSFPDAPRAVLTHGIQRSLGPVFEGLRNGMRGVRFAGEELKAAGPGWEFLNNQRIEALTDMFDNYGRSGRLERALSMGQSQFGNLSLMTQWNGAMKHLAGMSTMTRLLDIADGAARGRLSKNNAEILARLGIDADSAKGFADQFAKHGFTEDGAKIANSADWEDDALREMWLNAVNKEVDRLIVTPGLDKPLLMSTTLGRVLLQFQSYNFAATQRVLGSYMHGALTAKDAHTMMTIISQIGIGMLVAKMKADTYGVDTDAWSNEKWLVEGVDRSGVLAVLTQVNLMAETASGGNVGLSAIAGEGPISRTRVVNQVGAFLGPTFGAGQDAFTASAVMFGAGDKGSVAAARRLLPLQNLFYLRTKFDALEETAVDAIVEDEAA